MQRKVVDPEKYLAVLRYIPQMEQIVKADFPRLVSECLKDYYNFAEVFKGEQLHHCVGSSERYWDRIERRESYVLFLRHTSDPDKPYYTLEVEPDGTVRQKRTMYDRQEADIDQAKRFLRQWQKIVSTRLTATEHKLAVVSKELRKQEFAELKRDKVIIHTGDFYGRSLLDLLKEDLMENTNVAAEPVLAAAA